MALAVSGPRCHRIFSTASSASVTVCGLRFTADSSGSTHRHHVYEYRHGAYESQAAAPGEADPCTPLESKHLPLPPPITQPYDAPQEVGFRPIQDSRMESAQRMQAARLAPENRLTVSLLMVW